MRLPYYTSLAYTSPVRQRAWGVALPFPLETAATSAIAPDDSGAATDAVAVAALLGLPDAGAGADAVAVAALLGLPDAGAGADAVAVAALLGLLDAGAASEAAGVIADATRSVLDAGAGLDFVAAIDVFAQRVALYDSAGGRDAIVRFTTTQTYGRLAVSFAGRAPRATLQLAVPRATLRLAVPRATLRLAVPGAALRGRCPTITFID
jgi:hypothetical protein